MKYLVQVVWGVAGHLTTLIVDSSSNVTVNGVIGVIDAAAVGSVTADVFGGVAAVAIGSIVAGAVIVQTSLPSCRPNQ